ncbi:MAG: PA14 domain-containing protein, partial [Kiritimatiellae bacterium]|nr:PA14 domain-containing protein [Kiritimatiellia bacterium]
GGLNGAGQVKDSVGTTTALYVGADNVTASFAGTTDPQFDVIKVGSGTQRLTRPDGSFANAEIRAGTLELFGETAITGVVETVGGTLGVTFGTQGLDGKYYSLSAVPRTTDFVSYTAVTNFLRDKTPNVIQNSTGFGATFNALSNGSRFPAPYNAQSTSNFAVLWEGLFAAQTSGSYGFATASDDGSVVFINGQMVVDNNAMQGYTWGDSNIVTEVELEAGMHQIAIAFFEASGDQGLTVWFKPPGAVALRELPNNLLYTGTDSGEARVGTLDGADGAVRFTDLGAATLRVTDDADMTFGGGFLGSNRLGRVVKEGTGILTFDSGNSDYFGVLDVRAGGVVFTNGAGVLGTLSLASGTGAEVFGRTGLEMRFYDRTAADGNYSEFQSLAAWYDYLAVTFPGGPSYVTNSLMLGTNFDTGTDGSKWPDRYKQSGGAQGDLYDFHASGKIFLGQTGTYAFGTASDDGSMLYINGQLVVNNGYDQGVTARYGAITLTAGFYDIDILYRENTGGNALRAFIAYPGGTTNLLPQAILFSGAALRGLAGEAGSVVNLSADAAVTIGQDTDTLFAGDFIGTSDAFVQKGGPGTLTLTSDNAAYNGSYSVIGGTLRVGDGGLSGALGTGAGVAIGNDGTLAFDRDGVVTLDGPVSGNGLIVLDGPGEVRVTSVGTFSGTVLVNNGRLTFAPGATLGDAVIVTNTAAVEVETSGTRYQSGLMDDLVGDGELVVSGTGTLVLNNANTYAGTTRVEGGATVRVASPAALGGGGDVALDGGTLAIQPSVTPGTNELAHPLDQAEWTRNGSATWTTRYDAQWLQLTPNTGSQAGSAYCNTPVVAPHMPWYASFRYETGDKMTSPADGFAFILQNDGRGLTALGSSGGEIGVNGITPSIGLFFNIYNADSIGWIENGARVDATTAINGLDLVAGVDVDVVYDGIKLIVTVTQGEKVYMAERIVDLYAMFGGGGAYVGFTGGTGGATAQQFVGDFAMVDAVPASTDYANTVSVADGQSGALTALLIEDNAAFSLGGFNLGDGATLNVSPAAGSMDNADYEVAASNVTVAAGTATVNVAANGTGTGVLGLERLTIGSGAKLVVTGAVAAPGGVLTVVVPTPVPRGSTLLADFTGAIWVGAKPTLVLMDAQGNVLEESKYLFLSNGKLTINTLLGSILFLR